MKAIRAAPARAICSSRTHQSISSSAQEATKQQQTHIAPSAARCRRQTSSPSSSRSRRPRPSRSCRGPAARGSTRLWTAPRCRGVSRRSAGTSPPASRCGVMAGCRGGRVGCRGGITLPPPPLAAGRAAAGSCSSRSAGPHAMFAAPVTTVTRLSGGPACICRCGCLHRSAAARPTSWRSRCTAWAAHRGLPPC